MGGVKPIDQVTSVLPSQDSATGRGLKTFVQSIVGFLVGLIVTVYAVPGVPTAVIAYTQAHLLELLLIVGVPSGLISLLWNLVRKDIPTY